MFSKNCLAFLLIVLPLAQPMNARPVVKSGGVVNAASYAGTLAQGSIITIFGEGLGPAQSVVSNVWPVPTNLAGVSVTVEAGGISLLAPLTFVSSGQLAAILPSRTPAGRGTLSVNYRGEQSAPVSISISRAAYGVFTQNASGKGHAILSNFVSADEQPLNTPDRPAKPGQTVILWGTGLGAIADDTLPPPIKDVSSGVQVAVDGRRAKLLYAGRSGCCAGLDQIAFEVPSGAAGCELPIVVQAEGTTAEQQITMSVTPSGSPCRKAGTLTYDSPAVSFSYPPRYSLTTENNVLILMSNTGDHGMALWVDPRIIQGECAFSHLHDTDAARSPVNSLPGMRRDDSIARVVPRPGGMTLNTRYINVSGYPAASHDLTSFCTGGRYVFVESAMYPPTASMVDARNQLLDSIRIGTSRVPTILGSWRDEGTRYEFGSTSMYMRSGTFSNDGSYQLQGNQLTIDWGPPLNKREVCSIEMSISTLRLKCGDNPSRSYYRPI